MVRRLTIDWPDARPFRVRDGRPIRWLVVSDDRDPALAHPQNRDDLGTIDAVVGCGDLEPDYLGFLADAFHVPVAFIRGNHDAGGRWEASLAVAAPHPLVTGGVHRVGGLTVAALEWPGLRHGDRRRHEGSAWLDALWIAGRRLPALLGGRVRPMVVISHAPPEGLGDRALDPYHAGYRAYRWLMDRLRPPLWLHGHVPPASVDAWQVTHAGTCVVNVTGAVLVEFQPPEASRR